LFIKSDGEMIDERVYNLNSVSSSILKHQGQVELFHSVKITRDGIQTAQMIRKGQLSEEDILSYKPVYAITKCAG
jgi:hypothetical protein